MLNIQQGLLNAVNKMVEWQREQTHALMRIATALEYEYTRANGDGNHSVSYTEM